MEISQGLEGIPERDSGALDERPSLLLLRTRFPISRFVTSSTLQGSDSARRTPHPEDPGFFGNALRRRKCLLLCLRGERRDAGMGIPKRSCGTGRLFVV